MNGWKHLKTINHHRFLVMKHCFRMGLYWQGLTHDLSKYSPDEFRVGKKYYVGTRSPNAIEREKNGYSVAWMHHKGRNRHHFEYWTDWDAKVGQYVAMPMPRRYLAEMVADRIAACKTYHGSAYQDGDALRYFLTAQETHFLHPETYRQLRYLLEMLAERGEVETFRFIKTQVLCGKPFAVEEYRSEK